MNQAIDILAKFPAWEVIAWLLGLSLALALAAASLFLGAVVVRILKNFSEYIERDLPDVERFGGSAGPLDVEWELAERRDNQLQALRADLTQLKSAYRQLQEKHNLLKDSVLQIVEALPEES